MAMIVKKPHIQSGFTLTEIIISLGIFLLVFTVMIQNFFLLQKTMHTIEKERTMTMFVSSAVQTIASDIDEYRVDITASASQAGSLVLVHPDAAMGTRITYTFSKDAQGKGILTRKTSSGDIQTYTHEHFDIQDGFFMVHPQSVAGRSLCTTHPSVTLGMNVHYTTASLAPSEELMMPLQTTFSSPETAYSYLSNCNP